MTDLGQAALTARALAEGQTPRPASVRQGASAWTQVAYVFAILFAVQLLCAAVILGVSWAAGF